MKRERIPRNHQVLECRQLRNGIEELFLMGHLVESEVKLFKVGEDLLVQGQCRIVLIQVTAMELNKLVPGEVKFF